MKENAKSCFGNWLYDYLHKDSLNNVGLMLKADCRTVVELVLKELKGNCTLKKEDIFESEKPDEALIGILLGKSVDEIKNTRVTTKELVDKIYWGYGIIGFRYPGMYRKFVDFMVNCVLDSLHALMQRGTELETN